MKKIIAIIAAIAIIATMSVSAFADTLTAAGDASKAVTSNYVASADKTHEIHVDITWTDMEFTYTVAGLAWDETKLDWYDNSGSWSGAAKVKVDNRSSKAVTATVEYTADDVEATWADNKDEATLQVGTAGEVTGTATTETFTLNVKADGGAITEDGTAGTIKVTIAA